MVQFVSLWVVLVIASGGNRQGKSTFQTKLIRRIVFGQKNNHRRNVFQIDTITYSFMKQVEQNSCTFQSSAITLGNNTTNNINLKERISMSICSFELQVTSLIQKNKCIYGICIYCSIKYSIMCYIFNGAICHNLSKIYKVTHIRFNWMIRLIYESQ